MEVVLTVGLPASGKSTWARTLVDSDHNWVRVEKDLLRAMLHNSRYSKGNENQVIAAQEAIIVHALKRGKSVIVSDTNLFPSHYERISHLVHSIYPEVPVYRNTEFLNVTLQECIDRDRIRGERGDAAVGSTVIERMYIQTLRPKMSMSESVVEGIDSILLNAEYLLYDIDSDTTARALDMVRNWSSTHKLLVLANRDYSYIYDWLKDANIEVMCVAPEDELQYECRSFGIRAEIHSPQCKPSTFFL